jgi:NitT/TauT family transport system substrate-binding protein
MMHSWNRRMNKGCVIVLLSLVSGTVFGQEPRALRFRMEWVPSGMYAPHYLVNAAGYDKERGFQLEMLKGNGSLAAIEEVNAGHADAGEASCGALATAIGKGRPVVSIAQFTAKYSWGFYIPKESPANSIKELAGKSVSMSPNSSEAVLVPALLNLLGMKEDALRKVFVDPAQKIATYGRGQADSTVTTVAYGDPIVQRARPSKFLLWADAGFVMPDYCIFAQKEKVESNPKLIQDFLSAFFKAIDEGVRNPQAAVDATIKLNPLVQKDDVATQWDLTKRFLHSADTEGCSVGWHSSKDWRAGLETLKKYGGLEGDISSLDKFFTNKFVPACKK